MFFFNKKDLVRQFDESSWVRDISLIMLDVDVYEVKMYNLLAECPLH